MNAKIGQWIPGGAIAAVVTIGLLAATPAMAIGKCGSGKRYTCVVDGDTLWLQGEKIRLQGYDTPETTTNLCGGRKERRLGKRSTERLIELLNTGEATIQRNGKDRHQRTLATIWIDGVDVADILVEGLARYWPDGREFWCE